MGFDALQSFLELAAEDADLYQQLAAVASPQQLVQLARRHGFEVDLVDLGPSVDGLDVNASLAGAADGEGDGDGNGGEGGWGPWRGGGGCLGSGANGVQWFFSPAGMRWTA